MNPKVLTIDRVAYSGKWLEFWFKENESISGIPNGFHASCKQYQFNEAVEAADMVTEIANKGVKGLRTRWVWKSPNWELESVINDEPKILTREECLELPIDVYNIAMEHQWEIDKIDKNLQGNLRNCEFCGRKYSVSCICDDGQKAWAKVIEEVKAVSNRDRTGE